MSSSFLSPNSANTKFSMASSASTPNLTILERRFSLSHSSDSALTAPSSLPVSLSVGDSPQHVQVSGNLPIHDSGLISASAPGSLQSSPRKSIPLSATPEVVDRPRTLPPKRSSELQKHIKEYEEISKQIKKAMEKEAKDKEKKEALKSTREKKLVEYRKVWTEEILPNWEKKKDSKKALEMWRFGLPPSVRGKVWKFAIGNELYITKELYDISIGHAQQTKATISGTPPTTKHVVGDGATAPSRAARDTSLLNVSMDELLGKEGTVLLVSLDLPPEFPARQLFVPGGPMHGQLNEVLEAYVAYRPDVGYAPCMSYLVAGFLLNMETLDSFICLANFINKPFNLAFYITDRSQMYRYTNTADALIETLLPKIHKHFQELQIEPEHYLVDWFMTIFLKPLPLDIASRVWDLYLLEGEIFLFKVMLALLKMYSHPFETYPKDMVRNILNRFPADLDEEELFDTIEQYNLDPKKFKKLLRNT